MFFASLAAASEQVLTDRPMSAVVEVEAPQVLHYEYEMLYLSPFGAGALYSLGLHNVACQFVIARSETSHAYAVALK